MKKLIVNQKKFNKLIFNFFIIFLLYQNIIFNLIEFSEFFNFWDEIVEIVVILIGTLYIIKHKNNILKKDNIEIICLFSIIILIGLIGNVFFKFNISWNEIFRDIVVFLKFPLIYFILISNDFSIKMANNISKITIKFIKLMICIIFIFGILSLFFNFGMSQDEIRHGIRPYMFLYSHPTYLVLSSILMLAIINSIEGNNMIFEIMLIVIIIISLRTKGIVTIAAYIFAKYIMKNIKSNKILNIICIVFIIFVFSYSKLALYKSYSTSPREQLYNGAITLIKRCFPVGSGFSTYASHGSVKSSFSLYEELDITFYLNENAHGNIMNFGDAGYAYYLGQFGFLGCILICILGYKLYIKTIENTKNSIPMLIILLYVLIALTSETILLNYGIELAFILAIVVGLNKIEKSN